MEGIDHLSPRGASDRSVSRPTPRSTGAVGRRGRGRLQLLFTVALAVVLASGYGLAVVATELKAPARASTSPIGAAGGPPEPCYTSSDFNVTLSQYAGPTYTTVTISGSNFYPDAFVDLYWVEGSPTLGTYLYFASNTTNSTGGFVGMFSLPPAGPAYSAGHYNVTAQDAIDDCASANYTLTSPSDRVPQLVIEYPTTGIGGTQTSVDGSYFEPEATINPVSMGSVAVSCSGGNPVVSSEGTFTCDFAVPLSLTSGTYHVLAYDATDGTIESTNTFTDTGGQTTTSVACSPTPFGNSSAAESAEFSTNCTASVSGNSPSGTVTWSSSSSTGTFFTWSTEYGYISYTPTDSCGLVSGECTISYSDTDVGTPTITANYGGNFENEPSQGTEMVTVVAPTISSVDVSCSPTEVTAATPATCTATVAGDTPTGTVDWTASIGGGYTPTLSSPSCTLADGSCSVTVTDPAFTETCGNPLSFGFCGLTAYVAASYSGDALYEPSSGHAYVLSTAADSLYDSYSDDITAGVNDSELCPECYYTPGELGGYGSEGALGTAAQGEPDDSGDSATFTGDGDAQTGEVSLGGDVSNGGYGSGEVSTGDSLTLSGSCDLSSDTSNLGPCLSFSDGIQGEVTLTCTGPMGTCGYAFGWVVGSFSVCDADPASDVNQEACTGGTYSAEACVGNQCTELVEGLCASDFNPLCVDACPFGYGDFGTDECDMQGSATDGLSTVDDEEFGGGDDIGSGDVLQFSEDASGELESGDDAIAGLQFDPAIQIVNLDPAQLTIGVTAATTAAEQNPSALQVTNVVTPGTVAANAPVNDTATLTNMGSSALTNISAFGSIEGTLSCPSSTLGVGAKENCSAIFPSLPRPGPQTDYVIANGTNGTDADVVGSSSASFFETPVPFNVSFNETGLPLGSSWSVIVNNSLFTTTGVNLTVHLPYGPYSYEVIPPPGYTATPPDGSVFVFDAPVVVPVAMASGIPGPVIGALSTVLGLYATNTTLQSEFPGANATIAGLAGLVSWAASVVQGSVPPTNFSSLAPYGPWYVLMSVYNQRPDLEAAFPQAYGNPTNFSELVDWAGEVVNNTFPDSDASVLAPFGPWYVLMLTYDQRPDLQAAFPQAYTNYTNFTDLEVWAGEVVNGSFPDSSEAALAPFGYAYILEYLYESRPDLQAAFPDALTNETSYLALVAWAGGVANGTITDSDAVTLAPYAYWYVLFGWVYEDRADLIAAFPDAFTNGTSYAALFSWAVGVVLGYWSDSAYYTLLPFAMNYESYS